MKLTGILSISNAVGLGYPFLPVIRNLQDFCDDVIVGVDPTFEEDISKVRGCAGVKLVESVWDRSNNNNGHEIAIQMDKLVRCAVKSGSDWVVVLQADELIHEKDFESLRQTMSTCRPGITGLSTERLYFWKNLSTIRKDWNARMVRIFRPHFYSFMAPGTDQAGMYSGRIFPGEELAVDEKIYHYSRVDDPNKISKRIRNLDSFFHDSSSLVEEDDLPAYDFNKFNEFDNYNVVESPPSSENWSLEEYEGTHPSYITEYYS